MHVAPDRQQLSVQCRISAYQQLGCFDGTLTWANVTPLLHQGPVYAQETGEYVSAPTAKCCEGCSVSDATHTCPALQCGNHMVTAAVTFGSGA